MSDVSGLNSISKPVAGPLGIQADKVLRPGSPAATEKSKIDKSSKEFESILLGSWLQQAEESFGSLPGGDDAEDADPGKEQFQGLAMQSLGTSMTSFGGIGIAKMISAQLYKTEQSVDAKASSSTPK